MAVRTSSPPATVHSTQVPCGSKLVTGQATAPARVSASVTVLPLRNLPEILRVRSATISTAWTTAVTCSMYGAPSSCHTHCLGPLAVLNHSVLGKLYPEPSRVRMAKLLKSGILSWPVSISGRYLPSGAESGTRHWNCTSGHSFAQRPVFFPFARW